MPIPTTVSDLNTSAALNSPAGSESPTQGDDFLRAQASIIRQVSDAGLTRTDAADVASATKGAGAVGFTYALAYAAGTIGKWLQDLATSTGSTFVGFIQAGTGAVLRTLQAKVREISVSITDYGGVEGLVADNTTAFNNALAALGTNGGVVEFPVGNWRGNFVVNQHNITLAGKGGVGELNTLPCLRPYGTGAGTTTLKISNQTRFNRKCGVRDIVISGDNGSAAMADKALWIAGGTVNFYAHNLDLMDGLHTLHIEPGGTYPATALKFSQVTIRNDYSTALARAVYVRKYADATGYVTDLQFHQFKVNKTGLGYWLEVDGTGSTGLVVHFGQTYVDHVAGGGILFSASGLETIECDGGLQVDPGAAGVVVMKRNDLVKDPTRFIRGHIEGAGGQKIEFSDLSTVTFPAEPGWISYQPLFRSAHLITPAYVTNASDPYNETTAPYFDEDTAVGPVTLNRSSFSVKTAGEGLRVAESANGKQGLSANMVAGTITIANTAVAANSRIFVTQGGGGANHGALWVNAQTAATSFVVTSTNAGDTGRVAWQIFEPA